MKTATSPGELLAPGTPSPSPIDRNPGADGILAALEQLTGKQAAS